MWALADRVEHAASMVVAVLKHMQATLCIEITSWIDVSFLVVYHLQKECTPAVGKAEGMYG